MTAKKYKVVQDDKNHLVPYSYGAETPKNRTTKSKMKGILL